MVASWLGLDFMLWPRIQSLVRDLRSYKLHGLAKKKKRLSPDFQMSCISTLIFFFNLDF